MKKKKQRNELTQRVQTIQNNLRKNGIKLSMTIIRKWYLKGWPYVCAICNEAIESHMDASLDHIQPVSRKGKPGLENCVIVHKECNQIKGDFTLEEIRYLIDCVNPEALILLKNRLKQSTLIFGKKYGRK